jgi:NAD(P)-dependent dehydrogenase (short-subunit alcohol dehydrogenase family)
LTERATVGILQCEFWEKVMQRFMGKVVLVTGAGSGIGKASALRLAAEGGSIFCVDLNREAVESTATEIAAEGGVATPWVCDVGNEASVQEAVEACIEGYGSLYGVVNMAGILRFDDTEELQTGKKSSISILLAPCFYAAPRCPT